MLRRIELLPCAPTRSSVPIHFPTDQPEGRVLEEKKRVAQTSAFEVCGSPTFLFFSHSPRRDASWRLHLTQMDEITVEVSCDEKWGRLTARWNEPYGSGGITSSTISAPTVSAFRGLKEKPQGRKTRSRE